MPSQALFDACDLTGSTLISIGPAITQTTFTTPGVHYFTCSVGLGFHCELLNMKVTVVVSEGQPVPVPWAWPPGVAAALALAGLAALWSRRRGEPSARSPGSQPGSRPSHNLRSSSGARRNPASVSSRRT